MNGIHGFPFTIWKKSFRIVDKNGDWAPHLGMPAVLAEDLSLVPSTHVSQLIVTYNSSYHFMASMGAYTYFCIYSKRKQILKNNNGD